MKQISKAVASAWSANKEFNKSNTRIYKMFGALHLELFGNLIAVKDINTGAAEYQTTGWETVTTRDRLEAVGCSCAIRKGTIYHVDSDGRLLQPVGAWTIRENAQKALN